MTRSESELVLQTQTHRAVALFARQGGAAVQVEVQTRQRLAADAQLGAAVVFVAAVGISRAVFAAVGGGNGAHAADGGLAESRVSGTVAHVRLPESFIFGSGTKHPHPNPPPLGGGGDGLRIKLRFQPA